AEKEPGDERTEPPATEAPFMQLIEIAAPPMSSSKSEPGDEAEQQNENREGNPIQFHSALRARVVSGFVRSSRPVSTPFRHISGGSGGSLRCEINDGGQRCTDNNQRHLKPIEKRDSIPGRFSRVIKWYPKRRNQLKQQQQVPR